MADKITELIYIGNEKDALNQGGDYDEVLTLREKPNKNTTIHIPIVDGATGERRQFERAIFTLNDCIDREQRTLVHCYSGRNRAPTVVAILLAIKNQWRLLDALTYIKVRRPLINPKNISFEYAASLLDEYALEQSAESMVPEDRGKWMKALQ